MCFPKSEIRQASRFFTLCIFYLLLIPEKQLRSLLNEQKKHLEEIKKATNYDSTRKLIERYDESTPNSSPNRTMGSGGRAMQSPQLGPATPTPLGKNKGSPRAPGHLIGAAGTPGQSTYGNVSYR